MRHLVLGYVCNFTNCKREKAIATNYDKRELYKNFC